MARQASLTQGALLSDPPGPQAVRLVDAVRDQLGLGLQPERTTIEVLVIDWVEKPTSN